MVLLEEFEGGHSPMMRLNGKWTIDQHTATETGGVTTDVKTSNTVWLNATQDVGGYCEGTWDWEQADTEDDEFLWGIDEHDTQFTIKDESAQDQYWTVVLHEKHDFIIERSEDGVTYRIEMTKND